MCIDFKDDINLASAIAALYYLNTLSLEEFQEVTSDELVEFMVKIINDLNEDVEQSTVDRLLKDNNI